MKGYGQFCPIAKASEVLGERWTNLIIRELGAGSESFSDLRRGMPLISPTLLSSRLKSLEHSGVVERQDSDGHIRYRLTRAGEELTPIIAQLGIWGHRWVRSDLAEKDLDPSLLVWDIHRNIDTGLFTGERTTINIEFSDHTSAMRFWWLVVRDDDVDVCLKDPGYEVDLKITTDLRTLTAVWMGDMTLMKALRERLIELAGDSALKKNISAWFGTSYFADVKPVRK